MRNNMMAMLQKAQQAKKQMAKIEKEFATARFTAHDASQKVQVTVNGDGGIVDIDCAEFMAEANNADMTDPQRLRLEKAIVLATRAAQDAASKAKSKRMREVAASMGLPTGLGGFGGL